MAQLTDLSVNWLSFVKSPATGKTLTLKSDDENARHNLFALSKMDDERMIAYGIVYAPDQEDSHGDMADADTIRKAAYEFMRESRLHNIDTEHTFSSEVAFVAESWLVRKADELFPDEPVGSWAVGVQIGDIDLWKKLKSGDYSGLSLAGVARATPDPDEEPDQQWVGKGDKPPSWLNSLLNILSKNKSQETEMDDKEVKALVRSEVGDAVTAALKEAGVIKAEPATPPAPETPPADAGTAVTNEDVTKAVTKAVGDLEAKIGDQITLALAKGANETGPNAATVEDSFV